MNRIETIEAINLRLRFIRLMATNHLLSQRLGLYLNIEEFFIAFLNCTFSLQLKTCNDFEDLEQPNVMKDARNKIVVNIIIDNNELDLENTVDTFNLNKYENPTYQDYQFIIILIGLSKLNSRAFKQAQESLVKHGNVLYTTTDIHNQIVSLRDPILLKKLYRIVNAHGKSYLEYYKQHPKIDAKIVDFFCDGFPIRVLHPTVLPFKLNGYADNLMTLRESKMIEDTVIKDIIELYNAYAKYPKSIFEILNQVYGYIRKIWVLEDLTEVKIVQAKDKIVKNLKCQFERLELCDGKMLESIANAIFIEAVLREKISLLM